MKKLLLPLLFFAAFPLLHAQCPNLDFSYRDFTNWKCAVSYVDNNNKSTDYESQKWVDTSMDLENAIMTDSFGVEANDCYRIPYIPDGLRQSVRLGYMYKNSYYTIKAEKIRYAFTVDSSNAILLLHYSFFLSVGHSFIRNDYDPQFGIYVRDTSGKTLYYYGVGAMDSGRYNVCRIRPPSVMNDLRIIYTPWKLSAVNLSPYIGKEVELIFYVSNCWQGTGMHFGLAYVVPECRPAKIDVQYCSSDKVARLSAPEGFAAYEWTDSSGKVVGSQQRLRIVGPADGSVYRCKMKPQIGYATYLDATIRRTFVDAGFALDCDTLGLKLHLRDYSRVTGSKKSRIQWEISRRDTGTLFVSGDSVVDCCIPDTGSYTVSLTAYAENGCAATRSVRLLVPVAAAVSVDSILVPRTPAHTGGSKIDPKVLISNRGNFDVAKVVVYAEVYGEDGVLLKRLSGQLQSLPKHSGKVFSFPNPYQVPMYGDTYRVKVYFDAVDFDADWSDDTLETVFGCRMDVTDFSLDSIVQPDRVAHLSGTSMRIQVGVSNRGSTDLKNVLLYAEVLDSGFTVIRRMQCYMDTLSSGRRRMVSFPSVYQVPDCDDIYLLRIYASRVQGDADASNDTLWEVFEILHDDAVEEYVGNGWQLGQNIPNPAAGRTLVPVTLPEAGAVRLQLFAADGRLLYRGELELPSGKSLLPLETGRYASGVYFYSVEYKGERKVRKMNVKP